ncbi:hypothetical protein UA08_05747 [Talaromyces atroroseus]|uniref:BZIP domain-containing protein n=1 Tax=Talaromyces atroroseus TaxID=1441469 RepID=A0A225AES4_TALAT|nr:hypothetical protein UA08_05747 [Talaromyces atroroseus]OKL59050.1 hypothetical protein UA08_05747 [Talaromyces atroroseus]
MSSGYGGRRAPNFAQYLEDLNAIPSPYDQSLQQQQTDSYNIDAELALFTNTEFLDFGHFGDMSMPLGFNNPAEEEHKSHEEQQQNVAGKQSDMDYLELLNDLNNIPDYSTNFGSDDSQNLPVASTFHPIPAPAVPDATKPSDKAAPQTTHPKIEQLSPVTNSISSFVSTPMQVAGTKRKQSHDAKSLGEAARIAAEEDKRRRNTAASARFRVKKKQREQALEKSVKEAGEKNAVLEARVSQLELENQWLKNLITEKNGAESGDGKQKSESDIAHMFKNFLANQKKGNAGSKIGVGTA